MNHRGGAAGSGEAADDDDERQGRTMGERERRGMKEGRKERGGSAYLLGYWSARCRPQTLNRARRDETVSRVLRPSTRTSFRQSPFSSHFVCRCVSAVEAPVQCHRRLRDDVVAVVVVVVVGSPSTDHVVHRKSVTASFRSNNTHTNTQKKRKQNKTQSWLSRPSRPAAAMTDFRSLRPLFISFSTGFPKVSLARWPPFHASVCECVSLRVCVCASIYRRCFFVDQLGLR